MISIQMYSIWCQSEKPCHLGQLLLYVGSKNKLEIHLDKRKIYQVDTLSRLVGGEGEYSVTGNICNLICRLL